MNFDTIIALNPGPSLDLLIAVHIEGWIPWEEQRLNYKSIVFQKPGEKEPYRRFRNWEEAKKRYRQLNLGDFDWGTHAIYGLCDFSTDIHEAWELAKKLGLVLIPQSKEGGGFRWLALKPECVRYQGGRTIVEHAIHSVYSADTAEHAICISALLHHFAPAKEVADES